MLYIRSLLSKPELVIAESKLVLYSHFPVVPILFENNKYIFLFSDRALLSDLTMMDSRHYPSIWEQWGRSCQPRPWVQSLSPPACCTARPSWSWARPPGVSLLATCRPLSGRTRRAGEKQDRHCSTLSPVSTLNTQHYYCNTITPLSDWLSLYWPVGKNQFSIFTMPWSSSLTLFYVLVYWNLKLS